MAKIRLLIPIFCLVILILSSCTKTNDERSQILSTKLNLIKNTKWFCDGVKSFTYKDTTGYYGSKFILHGDSVFALPVNNKTGDLLDTTFSWFLGISDTGYVERIRHHEIPDSIITLNGKYQLFWFRNKNILKIGDQYFTPFNKSSNYQLPDSLYDKIIEFEISGFKIGDFIKRDLIEITDVENWRFPVREKGNLKTEENVKLEIVGDSIIVSIEREDIPNSDIDDIIRVISEKTSDDPKYSEPDTNKSSHWDHVVESYDWGGFSEQYDISLCRYKTVPNESSTEIDRLMILSSGVGWRDWDLKIESSLLEEIIIATYFANSKVKKSKSPYIK